ncbi:MAG: hypothetical protein ACREMQ_04170, partial [Longimicrobiales bacterium]
MHHRVFPRFVRTTLLTLTAVLVVTGTDVQAQSPDARSSQEAADQWEVALAAGASRAVTPAYGTHAGAREADIDAAVRALSPYVTRTSHPEALRIAFQAYHNYKAARPDLVRKPYLYFVDFGLDNRSPRGYVFDMESLRLVDGPFTV